MRRTKALGIAGAPLRQGLFCAYNSLHRTDPHQQSAVRATCGGVLGERGREVKKIYYGLVLAVCAGLGAPHAKAVPLSVYGGLPNIENVALSPDGSQLAYVRTDGGERTFLVANVADHKLSHYVKIGGEKLRDLVWADNDNLLLETSITSTLYGFANERFMLRVYSLSHNEVRSLPGPVLEQDEDNHVINQEWGYFVRQVGGHTVVFVEGYHLVQGSSLFKCDLTARTSTIFKSTPDGDVSWTVDEHGQLASESVYDAQSQHWSIKVYHGGNLHEAASGHAAIDIPAVVGFGASPDTLIVESIENGKKLWRPITISNGTYGAPLPDDQVYRSAIYERFTDRAIGGIHIGDVPEYTFFDPALEAHWKAVLKAFDGDHVELVSAAADYSKIVVLVDGPKHGYKYELVDLEKSSAVPIGKVYSAIDQPAEVQRITYAAADGLEIPAYLTLPRGRTAKNLPLVVLPHGGPEARDTQSFDWWQQALADQGYAVLQPNYRGSTVTESFLEAGYGEFGRKMQTDLSDGVRYLAKQGVVDPARVCIVGASYGGYAALAGVTLDPGVYRCAVAVAGLSDLAQMLRWEGRGNAESRWVQRYWGRYWGSRGASDAGLDAISPVKHIDAVKVPVLLIHGKDDTVVPFEQSQLFYDALKKRNGDVQLVPLAHEDHYLSRAETRTQMVQATVDFLRAHNPPD